MTAPNTTHIEISSHPHALRALVNMVKTNAIWAFLVVALSVCITFAVLALTAPAGDHSVSNDHPGTSASDVAAVRG